MDNENNQDPIINIIYGFIWLNDLTKTVQANMEITEFEINI